MTLMLGTPVACTARAWVARRRRKQYAPTPTWQEWHIPVRGNYSVPFLEHRWEADGTPITMMMPERIVLEHMKVPSDSTNKSVLRAEMPGSGIIIGLERKMIGKSVGGDGEDYGWFEAHGHVDLYVVKSDLRSTPFFVPLEDAHPLALGGAGHAA